MSRDDSTYSIGTSQGILAVSYSRNQFEVCPTNLLSVDFIPAELPLLRPRQYKVHHLVSQIVQLANVRIAKLRDVPAGNLAEAAILNATKGEN